MSSNYPTMPSSVILYRIITEVLLVKLNYKGPLFFLTSSRYANHYNENALYYTKKHEFDYHFSRQMGDLSYPKWVEFNGEPDVFFVSIWDLLLREELDFLLERAPALLGELKMILIGGDSLTFNAKNNLISSMDAFEQTKKLMQKQMDLVKPFTELFFMSDLEEIQ